MARFDSAIALAKKLIAKNGQSVTLRSVVNVVAPDPTKPWTPGANTNSDTTVNAVFLDYSHNHIDGTLIQTGDQKVLMPSTNTAGSAIDPQIEGLIIRGTENWKIVNIKPLNPNGQSIMYELQVRK